MTHSLTGKRIVVTGAGRGLGRAIAIVAADHDADVVLLGRDLVALEVVGASIKSRTQKSPLCLKCDLSDPIEIAGACEAILTASSVVDVLINNGSPWLSGRLDEITDDEIISGISASVTGSILMTKGLLSGLRVSEAADVVNIVSTSGYLGWDVSDASVPFHAAKHGQSGFSDRLRVELKDDEIRVAAIYPPDFEDADPLGADWSGPHTTDERRSLSNREIIETLLFILSAPRSCGIPVLILDNMDSK